MTSERGQTQIPIEQISQSLDRGMDGADAARADGLEGLGRFCNARSKGLVRERARLSARLGANHPRVLALDQRIETEQVLGSQLALETARARTPAVAADANTYVLHGRVYHQLQPVPGLAVALLDEKTKQRAEQLGFSFTDDTGYFKFVCPGVGSGPRESHVIGLFNEGQLIYIDDCPISPQGGQVEYREILLTSLDPLGTPPPPGNGDTRPPPEPVGLDSLTLQTRQDRNDEYQIQGGTSVTGSVKLNAPASQPVVVNLSVTGAHRELISVQPTLLEFPAGNQEATFSVTAQRVSTGRAAELHATLQNETRTVPIRVLPARLVKIALDKRKVDSGTSVTGTVSLSGPAPEDGAVVKLSVAGAGRDSVTLAADQISVESGESTQNFAVATKEVSEKTRAVIHAVYENVDETVRLELLPR
jgi:hypothetical protein